MPEGDTVHGHAARLAPMLVGRVLIAAGSRWPRVAEGLPGRTVTAVDALGKNLLIRLDDDTVLRVHLGMTGRWRRWHPGETVRISPGDVALRLDTDQDVLICSRAPTVERLRARELDAHAPLSSLGPDLLGAGFEIDEVLARIPRSTAATVAELLLDQSVASGIGNVWKSELLFLHRLDPFGPPSALSEPAARALYTDARARLQVAVAHPGPRDTTGLGPGAPRHWVYGRSGRPCLRCRGPIRSRTHGDPGPRVTFWCPTCQRPVSDRVP